MPLILQSSTKENAIQRADVQLKSYGPNHALTASLMPNAPEEEKLKWFAELLTKDLGKPGVKNLEIVDTETGKVVAFAQWKYPTPEEDIQPKTGFQGMSAFPEGTNVPFALALMEMGDNLTKKYYDPKTMYYLSYMHVSPEYHRRGLGQRLMDGAILAADKDGAKAYLSASDVGKRLYVKYGFKDLEVMHIDLMHLGAIGTKDTTAMMREPQLKSLS